MAKGKKSQKTPAVQKLLDFLKKEGIEFYVRKQSVRYLEDNSILIDKPEVVAFYSEDVNKKSPNKKQVDLPDESNGS